MKHKHPKKFRYAIASKLTDCKDLHQYEDSFRRWLARELQAGRMTERRAMDELGISYPAIKYIEKTYVPQVNVTLPLMTEKEKQKLQTLEEHIKGLEKQLEQAQIKNITLETLIDVAEQQYQIPIRKNSGAKP
jgi:predicted transcriptional regulator